MSRSFGKKVVLLSIVAPLLLAAKCDGIYESMGSDGGTGGTESEEPSAGSKSNGVAGSVSGGSGGASCESYGNQVSKAAPTVTVRVTNASDAPIHFGDSETKCERSTEYFQLSTEAGAPLKHWQSRCEFSCEQQQQSIVGCTADCPFVPLIRLAPGASYDFTWNGTLYDMVRMPGSCLPTPRAQDSVCSRWFNALEGNFVVSATAYPALACETPDFCRCRDDEEACVMQGLALVRGTPVTRSATLEYPGSDFVEIVFD